ncbi:protein prune homolog 2 [Lingula anatina]|uniref:Protein prune homolog 2 n=1 Tax=Lingula anatina TaxID=7574 RepID=A0A2R2MK79_LINAN|nr:protein prune homolog 2 [Lingula anatina]|eukprot:XP_023930608.1 protein prune homolog 2 [Lingula anatina]
MEEFLRSIIEGSVDHLTTVHVVLGNEACDLDSTVAALCYAFYLSKVSAGKGIIHIPVLNIPKDDFKLRSEIIYFLKENGLSQDILTFRDDLDLKSLLDLGKLKLTLVDHNVLPNKDVGLESAVSEVIDHRKREREESNGCDVLIEPVGSCCTLIAEKLLSDQNFVTDKLVGKLLLGTILLDTVCLSEEAGRKTVKDEEIVKRLESLLGGEANREHLYDSLQKAKFDCSALSTKDLLKKDLKVITSDKATVAFSSLPKHIESFLSAEDIEREVEQFAVEQKADAIVLLSLQVSEEAKRPERQVAVWSRKKELQEEIVQELLSSKDPDLCLKPIPSVHHSITAFYQGDITASRKKILPLVKGYLERKPNEAVEGNDSSVKDSESIDASDTRKDDKSDNRLSDSELYSTFETSENSLIDTSLGTVEESRAPYSWNTTAAELSGTSEALLNSTNDYMGDLDPFSPAPKEQGDEGTWNSNLLDGFDPIPPQNYSSDSVTSDLLAPIDGCSGSNMTEQNPSSGQGLVDIVIDSAENNQNQMSADDNLDLFSPLAATIAVANGQLDDLATLSSMGDSGELNQGQLDTSQPSSRGDTGPLTPVNSFVDSNFDSYAKQELLPTFNNSEVVARIREKRSIMGDTVDEEGVSEEAERYPFTPQNSVQDLNFDGYAKQHNLPSFNSSEMVSKIYKKKKELEFSTDEYPVNKNVESVSAYPFTPQNSMQDMQFAQYAQANNLSDWQASDLMGRIEEKRASLGNVLEDGEEEEEGEEGAVGDEEDNHITGISTPLFELEKDDDFAVDVSLVDIQKSIEPMQEDIDTSVLAGKSGACFDQTSTDLFEKDGDEVGQPSLAEVADDIAQKKKGAAEEESQETTSQMAIQDSENNVYFGEDIQDVAHKYAQEIINKALDVYSVSVEDMLKFEEMESSASQSPDGGHTDETSKIPKPNEDEQSPEDSSLKDIILAAMLEKDSGEENEKFGAETPVETEYLPLVDPLHGNLDLVPNPKKDFSTDAEKDVPENTSFNQMTEEEEKEEMQSHKKEKPQEKDEENEDAGDAEADSERVVTVDNQEVKECVLESGQGDSAEKVDFAGIVEVYPKTRSLSDSGKDTNDTVSNPASELTNVDKDASVMTEEKSDKDLDTKGTGGLMSPEVEANVTSTQVKFTAPGKKDSLTESIGRDRTSSSTFQQEEQKMYVNQQMERAKSVLERADMLIANVNKNIEEVLEAEGLSPEELERKLAGQSSLAPASSEERIPADIAMATGLSPENSDEEVETAMRPNSLDTRGGAIPKRRIHVNVDMLSKDSMSRSESEDDLLANIDGEKTPDDLNTPDLLEGSALGEMEWESEKPEPIPELTAEEELEDDWSWRSVTIGDKKYKIDMKVIDPYKKVLSHGGYYGDGFNAIIIFAACFLPDRSRKDYSYVMDNLFLYVVSTLELLVAEDYMIVYFHGATPKNRMPSLGWLKRCYQMIDRRLRKNLKKLLLVHPTLWLRTVVFLTKPFIRLLRRWF